MSSIKINGNGSGKLKVTGTGSAILKIAGGGGGGGFNPSSLGGLKAWYKADGITGLSDGSPVPLWNDSSDNGNTALLYMGYEDNEDFRLIGPDADSPSWVQADANFNGKPTVHFKGKGFGPYGSGHKFSSKGGSYPASSGFTMYFVGRLDPASQDNSGGSQYMAGFHAPDNVHFGYPGYSDTMPFFRYKANNPGWGGPLTGLSQGNDYAAYSETLAGPGDTSILSYAYASGDNFGDDLLYINGSNSGITQTHSATKIAVPITDIYLGGYGGSPFSGNMAEFIMYEGKHSDTDRVAVTAYLAAKYGISI